jgi:3-oxoacyl-[acyl-carrier-protein] synthase-1
MNYSNWQLKTPIIGSTFTIFGQMKALAISRYTLTSAMGEGLQPNLEKLRAGVSGLGRCQFDGAQSLDTWVGEVASVDRQMLPATLAEFDCRNNRLAFLGLQQDGFIEAVQVASERYGKKRVAVFIGTSTSGIAQTELAYRELTEGDEQLPAWYQYQGTHNTYSVAEFVRRALGLEGICHAISTACSSSAKVFASAHRALEAGLCDAAVVGGVDSLCLTTLYGFSSLQLVASDICRPSDRNRQGLSIGEAAGFALLEKNEVVNTGIQLLGYGESGDAYHMSAPHPQGAGAIQAMRAALSRAGLEASAIDYINLHGTGTSSNDLIESLAVHEVFGAQTPCSSTKGFIGHTLGAAGIAEAIFGMLGMENEFMPCSLNTRELDDAIACNILLENRDQSMTHMLSNSFGFGGSNCSLLLGKSAA